MIPFMNHDDANRALMGSNMQKQATPCIVPELHLLLQVLNQKQLKIQGELFLLQKMVLFHMLMPQKLASKGAKQE